MSFSARVNTLALGLDIGAFLLDKRHINNIGPNISLGINMSKPSIFQIFILGYLLWMPLLLAVYALSPQEYPVLAFDDLPSSQSKIEVLNFLYTSLLTKITTWYQGLVGCIFGIFSIMVLLAEKKLQPSRVHSIIAITGVLIVFLTTFILFKTVSTYTMMCIVERSYPVNAIPQTNMLECFKELSNITSLGPLTQLVGLSNLTPKDTTLVFCGGWSFFMWPTLYVIIALYFHDARFD